jgi:drug/metabolite transporter (DMT)-like permease
MNWNRLGTSLGILSVLMLSLQYVLAQAFFQFPLDPDLRQVQGLQITASWTNTALLVGLRMIVFLPLLTVVNRWLQPNMGKAFQELLTQGSQARQLWWNLAISGLLLFLSQWLLYRGVGLTSAGMAVGIFFIYPGLVPLLHWFLAGDRPSPFRLWCMAALGVGATLIFSQPHLPTALQNQNIVSLLGWGLVSALFFSLYLVMTDRCYRHLNSGVVNVVQYGFVILFSVPALFNFPEISGIQLTKLGVGGTVLGLTAALSYILNIFAVQMMGPLPSMIINSAAPILTAILGFFLLKSPLAIPHLLGIFLITIACISLNLERIRPQSS